MPAALPSAAELAARYQAVVAEARELAGAPVRVMAVTKTWPAEVAGLCRAAGIHLLGENRVQEAKGKYGPQAAAPDPSRELHLIGPLQSNKAKDCPGLFHAVQSFHSWSAVEALSKACAARGSTVGVYLPVNMTAEERKAGFGPDEAPAALERMLALPGLRVDGLMTMGRQGDAAASAKAFEGLRALRDRLTISTGAALPGLSMGMSDDWRLACECGATLLRLGTALFGHRG